MTIREKQLERVEAAKALILEAQLSKNEISDITGCPISTISRLRREMQIKLPKYYGPDSRKAVLERLIKSGMRNAEIARKLGITKQAVSDAIKKNGLAQTGGRCPKANLVTMVSKADKSSNEIARLSGYSLSAVRLEAQSQGIRLPVSPGNPLENSIRA